MARQSKKPDERKKEILSSAGRLFFSRGYATTTITDIIEDAEISKGLFYYYFGSKEDVLDEIVDQLITDEVADLQAIASDQSKTVPERVMRMLRRHRAFMADSSGHVAAQLRTIPSPEIVIRTIRQSVNKLTPLFADVIQEGVAQGVFDVESPDGVVEVLLSAYTFDAVFGDATHIIGKADAFRRVLERTLGAAPMTLAVDD